MKKLSIEEMHRISVDEFKNANKLPLVVVLDNVRSLNNIGSVFRTADAFRVKCIYLCGITATPPHREIHKTALGAEDSVEWQYFEKTSDCISRLKEESFKIYALEQIDSSVKLDNISSLPQDCKYAVILGNEIEGVDDSLLSLCDGAIEIPQYGIKHSLNVSCAASIMIWELYKHLGIKF